jgi:hypothetical protein
MDQVTGTYRGGLVVLDEPADWPEGTRVVVRQPSEGQGLTEDQWPATLEGTAALLARWDAMQPLELTPEDEAEIAAAREAVREKTLEAVRRQMGLDP